MSIVMTRVNSG